MKKVFMFFAAAALIVAGCSKPQYIIPIDDGPDPEPTGGAEKTFVVNVEMQETVETTGWAAHVGTMPGDEILDFFDMTETEFYTAMGTYTGTAPAGTTSQENNTIMFGVADQNDHTDFKWIPSTSNNFGHWVSATGRLTYWNDSAGDKAFYVESNCEWGQASPDAETLASMWEYNIGFLDGLSPAPKAGDVYKVTQVFYTTDDDDEEYFAFVEWNIKITAAEEVKVNIVKTQEIALDVDYYDDYTGTAIDIDLDALQAALGVSETDCTVYAVNADGSLFVAPGTDFWFSIEGDRMSHGEGCGIDINRNLGYWSICNYPDQSVAGKTCKGAVVFVNEAGQGYLVKVSATIAGYDPLLIREMISYEAGETVITLSEEQIAAIAEALGVETVTADQIGADIAIVGLNADGSEYTGEYTANNGYWYGMDGNVSDWAGIEAAGYVGSYVEYRADFAFGLGLWEEPGVSNTVKLALKKEDKSAVLTFVLTVAEPALFETEEVGAMTGEATMELAAGYGGPTIVLDYDAICSTLGLTDDNFVEKFKVTAPDGSVEYTGEAPGGYWFNPENAICNWGDVNSAYYLNFKYGDDLPANAEGKLVLIVGVRNENTTNDNGEVTHTCPPAGTYTAVVHLANVETLKHIKYSFTLTVTE